MEQFVSISDVDHYNNPPLIEAVFEFLAADPGEKQTNELVPLFQKEFPEFSEKPEYLVQANIEIQFQQGGPTIAEPKNVIQPRCRLRMPENPNNNLMIQFDPEMCALNVLKPYHHFEVNYLPIIERLFNFFVSVVKPYNLRLTGQRYINYISLPTGADPEKYFRFYPKFSPDFTGGQHPRFSMQVEHSHLPKDGSLLLSLNQDMEAPQNQLSFYLDIYARCDATIKADWNELRAWHMEAHQAIKQGFHSAITDETKKLFV